MYNETFEAVQGSIHEFCSTLKSNPETLHAELNHLRGLPIFLFGHSFGGLVSIHHAELYPNQDSFDGYISLNGGLNSDMPGWVEKRMRSWYLNNVNNSEEIEKITKPILLLHTITDSNVNFEVTNNWAKNARKILFKNKVPLDVFYTSHINPGEAKGEGHYIPEDGLALEEYVKKICQFVTKIEDLDTLSRRTALSIFQWELYANKLLRKSTAQERFLSEAFKLYKAHPNMMTVESFESDWDEHYNHLFNVIYLFEEFIRKKDLPYLDQKKVSEVEEVFSDKDKNFYPLSYTLWSIRTTARDEDTIKKALLINLPSYLSFIRGNDSSYKDGNFPDNFDESFLKSLMTDKVVNAFWSAMTNPNQWWSYRARYTLAFSYFLNNPKLLHCAEPYTNKSWWTTNKEDLRILFSRIINKQQEAEIEERNKAKAALKKAILKDKKKVAALEDLINSRK
ncbi:MAG: hypothetical protein H0X26_08440 [Alphaproteobacteria bacterium]|nr:hypothetical protein [Alphaproteobacteria bacterium]